MSVPGEPSVPREWSHASVPRKGLVWTQRVCAPRPAAAHCDPKPKAADAMPEDASMQEREDKLTAPQPTSERNADQGSDRAPAIAAYTTLQSPASMNDAVLAGCERSASSRKAAQDKKPPPGTMDPQSAIEIYLSKVCDA